MTFDTASKDWKSEAHTRFSCRDAHYVSRPPTYAANGPTEGLVFIDPDKAPAEGGERMLPVIPLLGSAATEVPRPGRPSDAAVDKHALLDLLRKRVGAIGDLLIDTDLGFLRLNRLERLVTRRALHWWLMWKLMPVAKDQLTQALGSLEGQPKGGAARAR
jgi:hypothetical protein